MIATQVHIRWMIPSDRPEVLDIERGASGHPWTEVDLIRHLQRRTCVGMVAEREDKVVGFMLYDLHEHYIEVCNFTVAVDCLRQGVGSQMAAKLIGKLSAQRRRAVVVTVMESNLVGQLFFYRAGFLAGKVVRRPYPGIDEDGYRMRHNFRLAKVDTLEGSPQ